MTIYHRTTATMAAFALAASALAHEGHDDAPNANATLSTTPVVEAHSDLFELVGNVEHGEMMIFLDRYTDNAPVKNAKIEIESGQEKGVAALNPDGSYTFKSPLFSKPGQLSLTFTINAGKDADLLAGDLFLPAEKGQAAPLPGAWPMPSLAVAGALATMAAMVAGIGLRMRRARKQGAR